jgi:hypothetical protein
MVMKKIEIKDKKLLVLVFFFFLVGVGLFNAYKDVLFPPNISPGCEVFYNSKCINGTLYVALFNPGKTDYTDIQLTFPVGNGLNIYNINAPLPSQELKTVGTENCNGGADTSNVELRWCCEDNCYKVKMRNPDKNITFG